MSPALTMPRADGAPHRKDRARQVQGAGRAPGPVAPQLAALDGLGRDALLALWSATLGGEPPARLSQPFLRRILAWELQARTQGGLSSAITRKLESLAAEQARGKEKAATPKMKPGGRFLREWGGVTHVVDVVEGGYLWRGERHRSLSAIARAITGAHWSGPRFFGLKESGSAADAKKGSAPSAKSASRSARRAA